MFNRQQYKEFRHALKNGVNPRILENMTAEQMRETLLAAESNLDLSYFTPDVSAEKMHAVRNLLLIKAEVDPVFVRSFNAEQLHQIKLGIDLGLDVEKYRYPYLTGGQMHRICIELLAAKVVNYVKENGLLSIFTIFRTRSDSDVVRYAEKVIEHIENNNPQQEQAPDIKSYVNEQFIPAINEVHMDDIHLEEYFISRFITVRSNSEMFILKTTLSRS